MALGSRFVLALFLARFLSVSDVGRFALLAGLVGILPALTGFGLNYHVGRQVATANTRNAYVLVADRMAISAIMSIFVTMLLTLLPRTILDLPPSNRAMLLAVVIGEVVSFDLQMMLIAKQRATLANIFLFVRSGLWVGPYVSAGLMFAHLRTLEWLLTSWLTGICLSFVLLAFVFIRQGQVRPGISTLKAYVTCGRVEHVHGSALIYLADVCLAGSIYLDRFVVSGIQSIEAAGVYFFYVSIANAVFTIVTAGLIQPLIPRLRVAYTADGLPELTRILSGEMKKGALAAGLAFALMAPLTYLLVIVLKRMDYLAEALMIPFVLLAFYVKTFSEYLNGAISAVGLDKAYALINVSTLLLTLGLCALGLTVLGLVGASVGLVMANVVMLFFRGILWRRARQL